MNTDYYHNRRRMMWLCKFAFPEIDTRRTYCTIIPGIPGKGMSLTPDKPTWYVVPEIYDQPEPPTMKSSKAITLQKFEYSGKRYKAEIKCAYVHERDTLVVKGDSFFYQTIDL